MRKLFNLFKKYWWAILGVIAVIIFLKRRGASASTNTSKPGVSRPPIDSSPKDNWGALSPADVPGADIIPQYNDVSPAAGDMADLNNEPLGSAPIYGIDSWNPIKPDEVKFAGAGVGGYAY